MWLMAAEAVTLGGRRVIHAAGHSLLQIGVA
jgi:hypothetical protein